MGRKPNVTVTPRQYNSALERRLKGENLYGTGSITIPLRESGYVTKWAYADLHENRLWEMKQLGWEPLREDDVDGNLDDLGLRVNESGYVVRGERGREVLYRMPADARQQIAVQKAERNVSGLRGGKAKSSVAEATAAAHGPEAGDFMDKHIVGDITEGQGL